MTSCLSLLDVEALPAFILFNSSGQALCMAGKKRNVSNHHAGDLDNNPQSSIAMRTACPPLNQPLSDHPETRTGRPIKPRSHCAIVLLTHCLNSFLTGDG